MEIPVLDFGKCSLARENVPVEDLEETGKLVYNTFSSIGFAYLTNTGITDEEAADTRNLMKNFFSLDEKTKRKYTVNPDGFGYTPLGVEKSDPNKPVGYKQAFDITGTGELAQTWAWPDPEIEGFTPKTTCFMEKARLLVIRILDALAYGMDLEDKDFFRKSHSKAHGVGNRTALRLGYYPAIPKGYVPKKDEMRLVEHGDMGSLTLLFQDSAGGLEVKGSDGTFIDATPIPETVLVNSGDNLAFWTNGRLKSARHRIPMPDVASKKNVDRYSLIYFLRADFDAVLSGVKYKDPQNGEIIEKTSKPVLTVLEHFQRRHRECNMPEPYV